MTTAPSLLESWINLQTPTILYFFYCWSTVDDESSLLLVDILKPTVEWTILGSSPTNESLSPDGHSHNPFMRPSLTLQSLSGRLLFFGFLLQDVRLIFPHGIYFIFCFWAVRYDEVAQNGGYKRIFGWPPVSPCRWYKRLSDFQRTLEHLFEPWGRL